MFEINTVWENEEPLKNICIFLRRGKSPIYSDLKEGPVIINQDCIRWDKIDLSKVKFHSADVSKIKPEFYLQKQDILINSTGTGTIGRVNQWTADEEAVVDSHVTIARIDQEKAENRYIRYFLLSEQGQRYLESFCYTGSTNQIELSGRYLRRLKVPLPESKEQKAIAIILSKVDEAIAAVENSIKAAERLKKSLMQNLLTGKLKPDGTWRTDDEFYVDEKFGKIPIGWTTRTIKQLTTKITDGVHSTPNYTINGIPFLSVTDLRDNKISFEKCKYISHEEHKVLTRRCKPEKGDILMGKVATLGVCDVIETDDEFSIFVQIALLKVNQTKACSYFINHVIQTLKFRNSLLAKAAGTTIKYIGIDSIGKISILVPDSVLEQKAISGRIREIEALLASENHKSEALKNLKKSLMQNLLTGKKRLDLSRFEALLKEMNAQTDATDVL